MILEKSTEQLTPDQAQAWKLLMSADNVFLTGEAGSGKSFLIRQYMRFKSDRTFPMLASTGAAAVLVGGRTFHSFMGLGIMEGGVEATVARALKDRRLVQRLEKAEGFIVDEVSMLSGATLQAAELICQGARKSREPWGGLRVIAVGDFAQLPPVTRFHSPRDWAFTNYVWEKSNFRGALLKQNMRIGEQFFLQVLNSIRRGEVNTPVIEFLNERQEFASDDFIGTRLFPRREQTDQFNHKELHQLRGELVVFPALFSGAERFVSQLKRNSPLPDELHLKIDALVMLRQNDPKMRWVNGSTGYVRNIEKHQISVELLNGRVVEVEPATFSLLNAEGVAVAAVTNFPMTLAYATTIHKAQGMTIDRLMVSLDRLWEPGQAYVALSRVVDPMGLCVQSWQQQSIRTDPMVQEFYQNLENP